MDEPTRAEIRAMVLLTLPFPPLPVSVTRVELDDERLHDDGETTSHTIIARGLDEAMARNRPEENKARRARQIDVFRRFLHAMAADGFSCTDGRLHEIYCMASLNHISTYFPPGHPIDIRFVPLPSICKGDKAHSKMAEYMASQSVYYEDAARIRRDQYVQQDFATMLRACRDRLGHIMTEDERTNVDRALQEQAELEAA
jgi:hypothetical protein